MTKGLTIRSLLRAPAVSDLWGAVTGSSMRILKPFPGGFAVFALLLSCFALLGCPTLPAPDQPKVLSGSLMGHRVCGNLTTDQSTFSFTCDALPTNSNTGWQLTPVGYRNATGGAVANRGVILKVLTPSLTNVLVQYENAAGNAFEQTQIRVGHGDPKDVGANGEVAVDSSDDGTMKTWTLAFIVNTCTGTAKLNIYDVGANGTRSTNPLVVYLLRDPNEIDCPPRLPPVLFGTTHTPGPSVTPSATVGTGTTTSAGIIAFASSVGGTNFNTIDLSSSTPSAPAYVTVPYTGASVLSCSGTLIAAANRSLGNVALFQIDGTTHTLRLVATTDTHFGGIGAIKLAANKILVGELLGPRVVIVDVSDPLHPAFGPVFTTRIQGINSVGLSGSKAVVAGPNNSVMEMLTVSGTTISNPTDIDPQFPPGASAAGLKIAMDGSVVAVGPPPPSKEKINGTPVAGPSITTNSPITLIDVSTSPVTRFPIVTTQLPGVSSIALKGKKVVAGSVNSFNIAMIDFGVPAPAARSFAPASARVNGGGWYVTQTASRMALGNFTGFNLALFNISGTSFSSPTLLNNITVPTGDIGSMCIDDF